jgi:uncharacterized protein (TIGR03032 family)
MQTKQMDLTAPFSCQYSSQVPELLMRLGCSLAITTYQAGKVVFISPKDEDSLVQLPRTFDKPMGIAQDSESDRLALACRDTVEVFSNSKDLATFYPPAPNKYDALYMPRLTYRTGSVDIHDLNFGRAGKLFAVNTLFSCIITIDDEHNFKPYWTPPFVDQLSPGDKCHLNGMAMENGLPKYATAFNTGNTQQSWRENITKTGVIIDVTTNEIIVEGLAMPHSPRIFNGELYCLLSATSELIKVNTKAKSYEVVMKLDGFLRGMDLYNDYLFIGLSKLRKNSSTFAKLEIAESANEAGIAIVHLPTKSRAGKITYSTSLDEIYDVHVLKDTKRPNILNTLKPEHTQGISTPSATFWAKPRTT